MICAVTCFLTVIFFACQSGPSKKDEMAIIQTVQDEKDGAWKRDYEKWAAQWAHEPYAEHALINNGWWMRSTGWDSIDNKLKSNFSDTSAVAYLHEKSGFQVLNYGDAAFVTCNERTYRPGQSSSADSSLDFILLEKKHGRWMIAKLFSVKPVPTKSPQAVLEANINDLGYTMAANQKFQDALVLFQLNARLFPGSWNVYDSLGEAYMKAGDRTAAIKSYEKSLKLNPQNRNAEDMLRKLKGK
jgi:tetratricopeptide (TPR) repeat protein